MADPQLASEATTAVDFDGAHLDHITMQDQSLALEVLGLFLGQLPLTLARLAAAGTAADWQFTAHGLKGSAAAVGARRLSALAAGLEEAGFPESPQRREKELQSLQAAAAGFRLAVREAFPTLG
ncbi:MAG: Hpt domain-containing protein [Aestuariivirga sp.]|uniref:Hpt domain-containing protein n=1 Tax=Aestuariivirga sp. TaxID=2650926 RepID=UPI0038D051A0